MAQIYSTRRQIDRANMPASLSTLIALAVVGAAGGVLMGVAMEISTAAGILPGEYYWSAVLAGNALFLGFGWAMLALRELSNPKWLTGALLAAACSLVAALAGGVLTNLGMELKLSFLVFAAIPALLAGLWLAGKLGGAGNRQTAIYLTVGVAWLLIGLVLALMLAGQPTPNKVALPGSIPLWIGEVIWWLDVPLVLAWPLLASAFARLVGRGNGPAGGALLYFITGFLLLPLALAGAFAVTLRIIP